MAGIGFSSLFVASLTEKGGYIAARHSTNG
jgi:hypothetical protein